MPVNRCQIRNVYCLADPELYNKADNDDPEALLEGVAMAGLVGVLRQLGDLAEFAAEIFHDLHEEVMATAARGHGLLVRVQQLESEISPTEMACLSQTSPSVFFPCLGTNWHPKRPITQNVITTGGLPRFVMDSYEECRGPPRLFLLDKFDVGGDGACLKRYTDPSIFKVEATSYDTEISETQGKKNIHQTQKKGSRWKGGEIPEVLQPSHAKLHQLFLEERVQTGATEAAHRVKLKKRPKKLPFDPESYMNKLLDSPLRAHEATPITSSGSRREDSSTTGSASGSPMQYTSPCASSRKVDDNEITADDERHTYCLQNGYASEDIDSYIDALGTMDPEVETNINQGMYSDSNENQLQSQLSDPQSIENSAASVTRRITDPFGADSPPRPFACMEIPFRPRIPPVTDDIPVTQNSGHDITNETCIDASKVSNVHHVEYLEEHQSDRKDTAKGTSELCDVLRVADDCFAFVRNHNGDLDNKYPNDSMGHLPNILEMTKNQVVYDAENHSTDSVVSSSLSVISHVNELSSDTTFNNDSPATEEASEKQMNGGSVLVVSQDDLDNNGTEILSLDSKILVDHIEEKVDHSESQLHTQLPLHTEGSQLPHGTHNDTHIQDLKSSSEKVKLEGLPPLPPLPPMQWRMKKSNSGQLSDNHFPPSTFLGSPQMTGESTTDKTTNIEAFWSSSSPYPLPPIFDEIQNNTQPMRVQRQRNPLLDAAAAHEKIKMRKVSDQDTTQIPTEEERDTLLGQIRAKSFSLKPTVQTRPSIQVPTTNLRVAAILEKANAIRQAFAGSEDDDNESDNWSDS